MHGQRLDSGLIKNGNRGVAFEQRARDIGTFVVARDDENRDPLVGDVQQRLEYGLDHERMNPAAEEQIAAVYHQIDLAVERGLQRGQIIAKKVIPSAPALYLRPQRRIKAEMRVSEK